MKKICLLFVVVFACTVLPLCAAEIKGVHLPDSVELEGQKLLLNGAGLRTKFFFKIYAGALYLAKASSDAGAIIGADDPMVVKMHFIYNGVSAEDLREGWQEGFELTVSDLENNTTMQQAVASFTRLFTVEAKKDDVYDISWLPGRGVQVVSNGTVLGLVPGLAFKQALYAIWLGDKPVDDDLKEGLLGK